MLEGNVEVRENQPLGHERHHGIDRRIRVDVVETRPETELPEFVAKLEKARFHRTPTRKVEAVVAVEPVGSRILTDDQELLDTRLLEVFRFSQNVPDRATRERAAQLRNDAEGAVVIAPFADLQA